MRSSDSVPYHLQQAQPQVGSLLPACERSGPGACRRYGLLDDSDEEEATPQGKGGAAGAKGGKERAGPQGEGAGAEAMEGTEQAEAGAEEDEEAMQLSACCCSLFCISPHAVVPHM